MSVAVSKSVNRVIIFLFAAFLVALKDMSIVFPKNLVCPAVIDRVGPLDKGIPCGKILEPSNKNDTHLEGLKHKSRSAALRSKDFNTEMCTSMSIESKVTSSAYPLRECSVELENFKEGFQ